jgi:DNA-directed RNA polymerase subunit L
MATAQILWVNYSSICIYITNAGSGTDKTWHFIDNGTDHKIPSGGSDTTQRYVWVGLQPGTYHNLHWYYNTTAHPDNRYAEGTAGVYTDRDCYFINNNISVNSSRVLTLSGQVAGPVPYSTRGGTYTFKYYIDGVYVSSNTTTGETYNTTFNASGDGRYTNATVEFYDGKGNLAAKSTTPNIFINFDTSINGSVKDVTYNSMTPYVYGLGSLKDYDRVLKWYRKGPGESSYTHIGDNSIPANTYASDYTMPQSSLIPNSTYYYYVELYSKNNKVNTVYMQANTSAIGGTLKATTVGDTYLTMSLGGIANVNKILRWYYKKATDSVWTKAGDDETLLNSVAAAEKLIAGLSPETAYSLKAEFYDTSHPTFLMGTAVATATTAKQVAVITLDNATDVSLRINLNEMQANPTYARKIEWYIKRSTDTVYTLASTDTMVAGSPLTSISHTFAGLLSSVLQKDASIKYAYYDIKAIVYKVENGVTSTIATLTGEYATLVSDTLLPHPTIIKAVHEIDTKNMDIYWESPDHINSNIDYVNYTLQISADNSTFTDFVTVTNPPATFTFTTLDNADTNYYIRIKVALIDNPSAIRYSNTIQVNAESKFSWGNVVQGGKLEIPALKWNLICDYINYRLYQHNYGSCSFTRAVKGKPITAEMFNEIKTNINLYHPLTIANKTPGQAILASELLTLADAVN